MSEVETGGRRPRRPAQRGPQAGVSASVLGHFVSLIVFRPPPPHAPEAIYDTLVRMAQPFSLRYPLVDSQGNFGSVDDDPPAAMRYTEARLMRLAEEMLRELEFDTVDFGPNYDESKREPLVLPARFPNLLVNGSTGIAVGMATYMPPHHLGETVAAIVVTELPYGVKKGGDAGVIKKIADLVQEKVLTEISDLADHSDRSGMRIQIELKRDAVPQVVLNKLFKHTALQTTFGYNAVALVGNVPRTLSLLELVREYLDHQREVVTRRL